MKARDILKEDLSMDAKVMETDHEVQMARADLYKTAKYAVELHSMLKGISEAEGLEGWVQAKITKAADYISSVKHYLEYEMAQVDGEVNAVTDMPVSGQDVPQEESISEFQSRGYTTKEVKMAKGIAFDPRYKAGNMTGAVEKIEKIKKGLSSHPEVEKALKAANENVNLKKVATNKIKKKLKLEK
jgi:hypothetical protein